MRAQLAAFFLALRLLAHRPGRLALAVLSLAAAVTVMFMQMGFFHGLLDSQSRLGSALKADLVILHINRWSLLEPDRIPRIRLQQARAEPGVAAVVPVYEDRVLVGDPKLGLVRSISLLAFPAGAQPLLAAGLDRLSGALARPGTVLFDTIARDVYGPIHAGMTIRVNDQPCQVAGLVPVGPAMLTDGFMLMGEDTWFALGGDPDEVGLGLVTLAPGTDLEAVRRRLFARMGGEVAVLTPQEVFWREVLYVSDSLPVGNVFGIAMAVGFLIGVIVCQQVLFNEINDHLPHFATLKAMGFTGRFLVAVVLAEAVLLAVAAFGPGLAGGALVYAFVARQTGLLMMLTGPRVALVGGLTLAMCLLAGLLALRKVLRASPATLFV